MGGLERGTRVAGPLFPWLGSVISKCSKWKCFRIFAKADDLASRPLTAADLGVKGALKDLDGTFSIQDGVAKVRFDMIRGDIKNPFQLIDNLSRTARDQGAGSLRIEATLANERLYNILVRRYGLVTEGSNDIITIPLK